MKPSKILFCAILLFTLSNLHATLVDVYKKGMIKIIVDQSFGNKTDWESLLYDFDKSLIVAPDGSIFICNLKTHNFYKFNSTGTLLGTYSQKGSGPQDMYMPTLTSYLDEKYLVFFDYPPTRKVNFFDFNGRYVSTIRTKESCSRSIGLKNGYIAYYASNNTPVRTKDGKETNTIYIHIVNIKTREEKIFALGDLTRPVINGNSGFSIAPGDFLGDITMEQTKDGNLLTGISDSPELKIFSNDGKLLNSIRLQLQPILVTATIIENSKKDVIQQFQKMIQNKELFKRIRKDVEKSDFTLFFRKYLPYYKAVIIDAEGNILVFKYSDAIGKIKEKFQVYSSSGNFICETVLDVGELGLMINSGSWNLQFAKDAIYGIFDFTDEFGDSMPRLVKSKY